MDEKKGFYILFGPPGTWKTTEALKTFQGSIYIGSAVGNDQMYQELIKTPQASAKGWTAPKVVTVDAYSINGADPAFDQNGNMLRIPLRVTLYQIMGDIIRALVMDRSAGKPIRYRNVIIDEVTAFWDRLFTEVRLEMLHPTTPGVKANKDGRAHYGELGSWTRDFIDYARTVLSLGANLIAIAHDREPEDGKQGGPMMPSARTMKMVCHDAHIVARRSASGGGMDTAAKLGWHVFISEAWSCKARGIPAEMFDQVKDYELDELVRRCGFTP
jgi:hypothetical protein